MKKVSEMVARANAEINCIPASEAVKLIGDPDTVFVDLRDIRELEREGMIEGAFHCPRGMLEFWVDPTSPYAKEIFQSGKHFVFHCASGWRSALSTRTLKEMGLENISHIVDGFSGWKKSWRPSG